MEREKFMIKLNMGIIEKILNRDFNEKEREVILKSMFLLVEVDKFYRMLRNEQKSKIWLMQTNANIVDEMDKELNSICGFGKKLLDDKTRIYDYLINEMYEDEDYMLEEKKELEKKEEVVDLLKVIKNDIKEIREEMREL